MEIYIEIYVRALIINPVNFSVTTILFSPSVSISPSLSILTILFSPSLSPSLSVATLLFSLSLSSSLSVATLLFPPSLDLFLVCVCPMLYHQVQLTYQTSVT